MDWEEYSKKALVTVNRNLNYEQLISNAIMGLNEEAHEFIKEFKVSNDPLNCPKVKKELGDAFWYDNLLYSCIKRSYSLSNMAINLRPSFDDLEFSIRDINAEITSSVKKHLFQGHDLDTKKIKLYLDYKLTQLSCYFGDSYIEEVYQMNIDKLYKRYEGGKFTSEQSINRED